MSSQQQPAVVSMHNVFKTYRLGQHVIPALQGVDLTVQRGELLALTGPSGSGKSTILNLCGLIDTPDAGEIALNGQSIGALDEDQRTLLRRDALGFVFQSFNLVPVMTVAELTSTKPFANCLKAPVGLEPAGRVIIMVRLEPTARLVTVKLNAPTTAVESAGRRTPGGADATDVM